MLIAFLCWCHLTWERGAGWFPSAPAKPRFPRVSLPRDRGAPAVCQFSLSNPRDKHVVRENTFNSTLSTLSLEVRVSLNTVGLYNWSLSRKPEGRQAGLTACMLGVDNAQPAPAFRTQREVVPARLRVFSDTWLRPSRLTWGSEKSVCPHVRFKAPPLLYLAPTFSTQASPLPSDQSREKSRRLAEPS